MKLRTLTNQEIIELALRPSVKQIAVENFLSSMGDRYETAMCNLAKDATLYKWSPPTISAIRDGINIAKTYQGEEHE